MADSSTSNPIRRSDAPHDEFYVGYLPLPPGLSFYVRLLIPVALWCALGAAAIIGSSQPDPGDGIWHTERLQSFEGVIESQPYPMLRIASQSRPGSSETLLLVETGKFGGGQRAAPFDGKFVRVNGWLIERNDRRMIELEPGDNAIRPFSVDTDAMKSLTRPTAISLGMMVLRGEIVDSKCYLGVMKPGEGKTHKECATLCISGGIPPMFVTKDAMGRRSTYLLVDRNGGPMSPSLLPLVADPVEVRGTLEALGNITLLKADPIGVSRL